MQRHDVGAPKELIERDAVEPNRVVRALRGAGRLHAHAKRVSNLTDAPTDRPEPDDTQQQPIELGQR